MKIHIIASEVQKKELNLRLNADVTCSEQIASIDNVDCLIDLLYNNSSERIVALEKTNASLIIVNSVIQTLIHFPENFVRINGWPTFLQREIAEIAANDETLKMQAEQVFSIIGKKVEWVPDITGLVTPRVVSMIINEAYFALEENVSTKEETDIAMKLGTNYPYGPFEWVQLIGLKNIFSLLETLSQSQSRYKPCTLLKQEALLS